MPKFPSLFKNKKILFFVFFLILILAIILPQISFGQTGDEGYPLETGAGDAAATATAAQSNPNADSLFTDTTWCPDGFGWGSLGMKYLAAAVIDISVWPAKEAAAISVYLADWAISNVNNWSITNGNSTDGGAMAFSEGWKSTRDLANMLIVLGFVIVGIATSLRIRDYEAKKALWPLIIVALLVNFSGLFCGIIIDAGRLTMAGLVNVHGAVSTSQMGSNLFSGTRTTANRIACIYSGQGKLGSYLSSRMEFAVVYLSLALSFFYLTAALIIRYAVLGILFVLSPIAFVFYAFPFPKAKDLWNKWWSSFLKWAFIGVEICFFIHIAATMFDSPSFKVLQNIQENVNVPSLLSYLFVIVLLLVTGTYISIKSSGALGAAVLGLAGGAAGLAAGAVVGGAKIAGRGIDAGTKAGTGALSRATGIGKGEGVSFSGAGRAISSKTGQILEGLGLRKGGQTRLNAGAGMKDVNDRVNSMTEEDLVRRSTSRANTADGIAVKAAATQKLAKDGKISKLGSVNQQEAAVLSAENYFKGRGMGSGDVRTNAAKTNPLLTKATQKHINEATENAAQSLAGGGGMTIEQARTRVKEKPFQQTIQQQAGETAIAEAFSNANVPDIRKFSNDTLKSPEFIRHTPASKISKAAQEMSGAQIGAIKTHISHLEKQVDDAAAKGDKARERELFDKWAEISTL